MRILWIKTELLHPLDKGGRIRSYQMLRSLDTLDQVIGSNTRLILRTDAAPFRVLVDGPDATTASGASAPPSAAGPAASVAAPAAERQNKNQVP